MLKMISIEMLGFLQDAFVGFMNLLFPNCCFVCDIRIEDRHKYICDECLMKMNFTNYHLSPKTNEMYNLLANKSHIESAFALFYFNENTKLKDMIHFMKYKDRPDIGFFFGETYGKILSQQNFDNIYDLIIPIPLHKKRLRQRGYNQSEMIAKGLSKYLNCGIDTKSVVRIKNTATQTEKNAVDREKDMDNAFKVVNTDTLMNKRLLLVDDVLTTGSTMISCVNEIMKRCKNCKISICVICRAQ